MSHNGSSVTRRLLELGETVGALRLANWLAGRSPRILMYHRFARHSDARRVGVETLRAQARLLRDNHFNVISMRELSARLEAGQPMEPKTVVITVDDGYSDFYTWAYPVFAEFELPVTVYATADFVDRKVWMWPDVIEYVLEMGAARSLVLQMGDAEQTLEAHTEAQRRHAWSNIGSYCLAISNSERQAFIRRLADQLKVTVPPLPVPEYEAMSWDQLREMSGSRIDVGGHTRTHPVLTSISRSEADSEIRESKARIEDRLDRATDTFAYPNGTQCDYDEDIKALVKAAGYKNATVAFADPRVTDDLYELRRYAVGASMQRFKDVVFGVEYLSMCAGFRQ